MVACVDYGDAGKLGFETLATVSNVGQCHSLPGFIPQDA